MKIIIVTVYNSYNSGSVLQARCLAERLSRYGEVFFLDTGTRSPHRKAILAVGRAVLSGKIRKAFFELRKYRMFRKNLADFLLTKQTEGGEDTVYVFGSDEIWNISRREMYMYPVFWGKGIEGRKISYAPSVNRTIRQQLEDWPNLKLLHSFEAVSGRDAYTCQMLSNLCGISVEQVVDPTMLFDASYYSELRLIHSTGSVSDRTYLGKKNVRRILRKNKEEIEKKSEGYIAVYAFEDRIKEKHIALIRGIADMLDRNLVGAGFYYSWCDENRLCTNPFDVFIDADFVITNTFHGTVFSILLNKQFLTFADHRKVQELLQDYGLSDRGIQSFSVEKETDHLQEKIEYTEVNQKIHQAREKSDLFIKQAFSHFEPS